MYNILIVGAGFSGAVIARELAQSNKYNILVVDERNHIAGNCYTQRDNETGVMEHVYGPHIFNTNNQNVWNYINRYGEFMPYTNKVKAVTKSGIFSLPINLLTINQLFKKSLNPQEAEAFILSLGDKSIIEPKNFEEQALKLVGRLIYETFFKDYTIKQWGCDPKELPASILKRLPIRFNYDDNYYNSKYQGIPKAGYTQIISNLLDHPNINVKLNTKYNSDWNKNYNHIFYSGPVDAYFNFSKGKLGYRSIYFERNIFDGIDFQGNAVINYCSNDVSFTRIHEHKHFAPWEEHAKSLYLKEFSKETGFGDIPFYPKNLAYDKHLLLKYKKLVHMEEKVSFVGRLATYRYMDMHQVIEEALIIAHNFVDYKKNEQCGNFRSLSINI
ncbi:UDP-galactopyranose mutase [Mucilaginibacter sp. SP1R1]|uniref:UDP-galactopyranose mutase n=1 Tax=Mucilaginibacter sp. SP1R1 TaxID=2723091 RepID=UPI00162246B0|nr:UDP-galactopyranose mutase [Mucilaginibacter sp. SP1R1]MBB6150999.1 UDP-galactopyranose mutase [Mucilaginibacter sp. SP1R1]